MRTGKNGIRRITAMVCALALCASMLPTAVFATEPADVADAPVAAVTQPVEDEQQEVVETPVQDETDSTPAPETDETKAETTTPAEPAEGVNESAAQPVEGEDPAELVEDEEETEPAEEPSSSVEPVEEVPAEEVQLFNAPVPRSGANIYEDTNLGISINVEQNTGLSPTEVTFIVVVEGQQVQKITRGDIRLIGETLTIEADGYDVECRTLGGTVTATYIAGQGYWNLVPGAIDGRVLCISIAKPKTSDDVTVANDVQTYGTFSWTKGEAGTAAFPRRLTVYVNEEYAYQTMVATPRNLSNAGSNDQFWFTPNTDLYNADVRLDSGLTLDTGAMADLDIYLTTKCSCGNSYCDCPGGKDCICTPGCTCEQCNPPQGETEIRTPYGTLEYNKPTGSGYNLTVEVYVNGQLEKTLDDDGNPLRVQVGLTGCLDFTPADEYYYFNDQNSYDMVTAYGGSWDQRTGYLMIVENLFGDKGSARDYNNVLKIYLWTFNNHTKLDVERRPGDWGGDANVQKNMTGYMISYEAYNPATKQNETYTYEATSFLLAQSQMIPIGTPVTITAICNSPYEVSQWSSADAYTALDLVGSEGNENKTTAKGNSATLTVNSTAYVSVTVYADSLRTVTPPTKEDLVDNNKDEIFGAENSAVIVDCVNADVKHANKTSGLKEDTFSISNLQGDSASGYYVTVTITKPDTYVEEYNKDFTDVTHERNDSETKIIRLNWEVVQQADGGKKSQWKAAEPATIEVICKEDTTIPDPTPEDLNKLGKIINIACTNNSSHDPITSAVLGGNVKDYVIAHEANSDTATVTIRNTEFYVTSYNKQHPGHTLGTGSDLELGLVYKNGAWELDLDNTATVHVTCPPIIITPADLIIYKGGEEGSGSSDVNVVDGEGKPMHNDGSLPEIGFYLQLSDELNEALGSQNDSQTQDLSAYITLTAENQEGDVLSWKLQKYGDGTSVAGDQNGYFIYKIVPAEAGSGTQLNVTFQDSTGKYVGTDSFTLSDSLSEEYTMQIYGAQVNASTLKAEFKIGNDTFTVGVDGTPTSADLTVRYVNGDQIDVVTHSYDSIEAASEADDPKQKALHTAYMIREDSNKFVINESNVQVDGKDVSLLFDDIVDSTSYEYEKTLTSKAVAAAINADGSLNGVTLKTEAKYLDLVESGNGNAWVTAQNVNGGPQAVKVYWPYPEGTDKYTKFYLAHFEDLDRDTSTAAMAEKLSSAKATGMSIQKDDYGISFTTTDFSPYVLVWEESQGQVTPPDNGDGNNNTTTNNNTQNTTVNVAANNSAAAPAAAAVAIPQTGDNSQPLVWIALVGISGAALAALAVFRRKRSDK